MRGPSGDLPPAFTRLHPSLASSDQFQCCVGTSLTILSKKTLSIRHTQPKSGEQATTEASREGLAGAVGSALDILRGDDEDDDDSDDDDAGDGCRTDPSPSVPFDVGARKPVK
jgi:hypothetical protein